MEPAARATTRLILAVAVSLLAFASNSVLARLALGTGEAEPLAFTGLRLISGAAVLWGLTALRRGELKETGRGARRWVGALSLLGYALPFSLAYAMLDTGTGALLLFACVQISMLAWAGIKGDRPSLPEWLGIFIAFAGLVFLVAPSVTMPDPLGAGLMAIAGLCWAVYSLNGRGSGSPLADTAGNFIRCVPAALLLTGLGLMVHAPSLVGVAYALGSGAIASGLGYAVWYAALPALSRSRAAMVQLAVPVIAAGAGVLLLSESLTVRFVLSAAAILGGMAFSLNAARRRGRGRLS